MPLTLDPATALVLIDLQHGTTSAELAHPIGEVAGRAARLLQAFRAKGRPVVIVTVNPTDSDMSRIRVQGQGLPGQVPAGFDELLPEITEQPGPEEIRIHKQSWNAFYKTPLYDELERRGLTGIVLAGVSTSIGVEGTARAAAERGLNLAFATDAMTDRVTAAHERSLQYIFPRLGQLGTTEEVLALV